MEREQKENKKIEILILRGYEDNRVLDVEVYLKKKVEDLHRVSNTTRANLVPDDILICPMCGA